MSALVLYILKLSCALSIVWSFYRIFLHNLTFYNLNRWYLLGYALLSFFIPFINIGPIDREDPALQPLIVQYIPVIGDGKVVRALSAPRPVPSSAWNWPVVGLALIGVGALLLLFRFAVRCISLRRMRQRAELLEDGLVKIYRVRDRISPFSFGNAIYINTSQHSEKEQEEIILHEYVHIRQRHTADILFAEFLTIFNWYNPFAWLIRYSIRQNLEFIADRQVVENGFDKKDYQYHLLKVVGQAQYRLANNFNFSSLKKRIAMMNKMRSARVNLLKFLFILPLLAVLLVAFRDRYTGLWKRRDGVPVVNIAGIVFDLDGRAPITGVVVRDTSTGLQSVSDDRGFYKFSIPVTADSMRIYLEFTKRGYDTSHSGDFFYPKHTTVGQVLVTPMWAPTHKATTPYMGVPYLGKLPEDPGYDDAVRVWKDQLNWNDGFAAFRNMQKAHPEVSLFYTTEGKQRQIVFMKNGAVEKYGYPDGPTVADMEKKYGTLAGFMKPSASDDVPGNKPSTGYLARWAAISAQAEKDFHAAGGNALAIVFPGDSRVIAVAADGQARVYDMDNDDPKERPAFEKIYGRLPDCVPAGFHYNYQLSSRPAASPSAHADTGVPKRDTLQSVVLIPRTDKDSMDAATALWLLDGVEKKGWTTDSLVGHRREIASISVFGPPRGREMFGEKGARGVIAILSKQDTAGNSLLGLQGDSLRVRHPQFGHFFQGNPLIIIDGRPAPGNSLQGVAPDGIQSMSVLKDSSARALYGTRGEHGVLFITTKPAPQVQFEGMLNGDSVKIRADSIVTPQGTFRVVNPRRNP